MNKRLLLILTAVALFSGTSLGMARPAYIRPVQASPEDMAAQADVYTALYLLAVREAAQQRGVDTNHIIYSRNLPNNTGDVKFLQVSPKTGGQLKEDQLKADLDAINSEEEPQAMSALHEAQSVTVALPDSEAAKVADQLRKDGVAVELK